jgi:glutathione S-transferase
MPAKLYVVQASHPCTTVARALELKGIPYTTVELPELVHIAHQQVRFRGRTVPGIVFDDGVRALGSRRILRLLDERVPDPPLVPADPAQRARVEELERWGDEVLQGVPRRLIFHGLRREPDAIPGYAQRSRFKLPAPVARVVGPAVARLVLLAHDADDDDVRRDTGAIPGHMARIERALDDGVIGGEPPNAADLQLAPSVALLMTLDDVAPLVPERVGAWARAVAGDAVGRMPAGTLTG